MTFEDIVKAANINPNAEFIKEYDIHGKKNTQKNTGSQIIKFDKVVNEQEIVQREEVDQQANKEVREELQRRQNVQEQTTSFSE